MTDSITEILDRISLLYKRNETIKQIYDKMDSIKPKSSTDKYIPVMDIYQFELKGYPADLVKQTKFGPLTDSTENECGIINAQDDMFSDKRSSCDIIKSNLVSQDGGDGKYVKIYSMKEFHEFYKKWKAKGKVNNEYNIKDKIQDVIEKIRSTRLNMMEYLNKNWSNENIFDFPEKLNELKNLKVKIQNEKNEESKKKLNEQMGKEIIDLSDKLHDDALIYNLTIDPSEKIVVFGDFHGSFHTFLRHIFRLYRAGIINDLDSLRIADGWRIIFLGDIVDRGRYAFEILLVIFELMIVNNTETKLKVILNRGNHEEERTNFKDGFLRELKKKFTDDTGIKLWKHINTLFSFLSSAIILKSTDRKFWMSHGGFYLRYKDNKRQVPKIPTNDNQVLYLSSTNDGEKINCGRYDVQIDKPTQIRWNDFSFNKEEGNCGRGAGYILSSKRAQEFMKANNIDFIIRAHQDSRGNSYLVSTREYFLLDDPENIKNIKENKIHINKDTSRLTNIDSDKGRNAVGGPIARVQLDGLSWSESGENLKDNVNIFPIMTLSTNTDYGRPLTHDSFGIIRFDLDESQIKNFNKETNIIDPRKDMINKSISEYLS